MRQSMSRKAEVEARARNSARRAASPPQRRGAGGVVAVLAALSVLAPAEAAHVPARPASGEEARSGAPLARLADTGIDIVRIPPKPQPSPPPPAPAVNPPAAPPVAAPRPQPPARQPIGRLQKANVKLGSVPSDAQKGWLGVKLEAVELPLALSLGLSNGNGAFIVEVTPAGPAAQGGLRFGDIIVSLNASPVANLADLRQRIAAAAPGTELALELWRADAADGDFAGVLRRLAEGGNAYLMARLGRMYAAGIGVTRDEAEAVRWYRRGAEAGNAAAMAGLAHMLLEGRGTTKDPEEGLTWLKAAVDKSNVEAMYALGTITLEGKIVTKNPAEAVRLFTLAAEAGFAPAMVDLGLMYDNANGVPGDPNKAAYWYRRAAEAGNAAGMVNLGYLYARGKGVEQNEALAVSWYRRAVAEGNAAGMHNLAVMADAGRGMGRDPDFAASLILQALEARYDFTYRQMTQAARNWSRDFRKALQRRLRDAGVYAGTLDGEFGDTTVSAIDAYIKRPR